MQEEFEAVLMEALAAASAKAVVEAASERFLTRKNAKAADSQDAKQECQASALHPSVEVATIAT